MKAVVDRIVQYANRYQLTNVETGEVLGTFDFDEVTGTVQQVGTEIDAELFDSIAADLAARVKLSGGELAETIVTFPDISGTAENVASGDTSATLWGKVKNWFSRLKSLAFKNKVAAGDFEAGAIKNADVAADAAIAQSKVSGLMTDYVASISVNGRTVTYKNKSGATMGTATTQDTTYELASQSSNGLMSSTDKTKLDGIESGAQKNTVLGVKGSSESAYRTGNVNITKANIGLGNVDNTSDEDKPVSAATQTALNGKANTSGAYPNMTVGKATNADNATNATNATNAANATKAAQDASGNAITSTYATKNELTSGLSGKANTSGSYPNLTVGKATNADNATNANHATNADNATNATKATEADSATNASQLGGVDASGYMQVPSSVTNTSCASGQWAVGAAAGPGTYLIGTFNVYDSNIHLKISGGIVLSSVDNTTDAEVFISTTNYTVEKAVCFANKLYTTSTRTGLYYTIDSSHNLRIFAPLSEYGKLFISAEITGGTIVGKGSSELQYPSGGEYIKTNYYFATDPSKLAPSTANGWTQTTATGTLPSAGVYMIKIPGGNESLEGIGIMIYDGSDYSVCTLAIMGNPCVVNYTPSGSDKWSANNASGLTIEVQQVYYKRIA